MNKTSRSFPRPLSELAGPAMNEALRSHGFASTEIVARWAEIAGPEVAAHSEPIKIAWPRQAGAGEPDLATLVLRVEGPAALEIQHLSAVILERVNRFFGWQAIGRIALRQAPLRGRPQKRPVATIDPAETARVAATLPPIESEDLRQALARLGAAIKRK